MNWLREKDLNLRPLGYEPIFGITQDNSGLPPVLRINSLPISSIRWSRAELKLNGHTLGTPTSESRPQLRLRAHRRRPRIRSAEMASAQAFAAPYSPRRFWPRWRPERMINATWSTIRPGWHGR